MYNCIFLLYFRGVVKTTSLFLLYGNTYYVVRRSRLRLYDGYSAL